MALRTPINVPLSVEHLQSIWQELNESYFQNRLPAIEIQWSTRLTASAGLFRSRTGPRTSWVAPEERHGKGRVIRLSVPLLSGQFFEEMRGTLAHEMIHQWQFDVKKYCPSHGREFRRIMALMNDDGLGITIYHTLAEETQASSTHAREVYVALCVVRARVSSPTKHPLNETASLWVVPGAASGNYCP